MGSYIIVQRRHLNGKSPASFSPSHSIHVESQPSGPSPTSNSDITYESDSKSESVGVVQGLSPGQFLAFGDTSNLFGSPSFAHFPENEDIYVDMSLRPDIIDSCPGQFGPLKPQFTTCIAGTSCTLPSGGMTEHGAHIMTQAPDMAPLSSLYAPSDVSWLDSCPRMHVDQPMNLPLSESGEFTMNTQSNSNFRGEAHRYNLFLEDVQPQIVSHIMDIVLKSQQQVKVKLSSAGP